MSETVDKDSMDIENSERNKHVPRTPEEKKALTIRLNRVEGQIRGIKNMIENDRYCMDILIQVSAAQAALNAFSKELLSTHIKTCVVDDLREGNEETIDELIELTSKRM